MREFKEQLKELREIHHVTVRGLDYKTRISVSYWNAILSGKTTASIRAIEAAAKCFNVKPEYFDEYRIKRAQQLIKDNPEFYVPIIEAKEA